MSFVHTSEHERDEIDPRHVYYMKADSIIAWVLSVSGTALGANLQTYLGLLPILNRLRLCHRYGQGPDVAINRLPVEIIDQIEEHLVRDARSHYLTEWEKDAQCFQYTCQAHCHFTEEELDEYHSQVNAPVEPLDHFYQVSQQSGTIEKTLAASSEEYVSWEERHDRRQKNWSSHFGPNGFFARHQELVREHFGLEIWFSNFDHPADTFSRAGVDMTTAFLVLPDMITKSTPWKEKRSQSSYGSTLIHHSFELPIKVPKTPATSDLQKFRRMLNVLNLKSLDNGLDEGDQLAFVDPLNFHLHLMVLSRCTAQIEEIS